MEECFKCKSAGFPNQLIAFQKIGEDTATGKNIWKLLDKDGSEHKHKFGSSIGTQSAQLSPGQPTIIDTEKRTNAEILRIVKRIEEAVKEIKQG